MSLPSPLNAHSAAHEDDQGLLLANGMPPELAAQYHTQGYWGEDCLPDLLEEIAVHNPQGLGAQDHYRSVTWRELAQGSTQAARYFYSLGIREGDGVIVQLPNSVAYVESIFGLWQLGAIPVFSLPAHGSTELRHFAQLAPARFLVGTAHPQRRLQKTYAALEADDLGLEIIRINTRCENPWPAPISDAQPPFPKPKISSTDLAFLQLSGGTTGVPKLIPRTHADYLYSVRCSIELCDVSAGDRVLVTLPAAHNFTMSSPGILGAIMVGASLHFAPDTSPLTIMPLVQRHKITHVAMVPPVLLGILNAPERHSYDLSSLTTLWVGGAKLSEHAARRVIPELGCQLQQVFGMAEGLVNYTRLDDPLEVILTTQGRPMSEEDEIKIVDENDHEVPPGHTGELLTRGPYTIRRYHRVPAINARSFTPDGFYRTGDLVQLSPEGNLRVVGRTKDQINRGGEKIAPEAVENVLLMHPQVHDASVVGVPDEELGEKTCAYLIPKPGIPKTQLDSDMNIRKFCRRQGLADFAIPDIIRMVAEFPLTGVGKVNKKSQRSE